MLSRSEHATSSGLGGSAAHRKVIGTLLGQIELDTFLTSVSSRKELFVPGALANGKRPLSWRRLDELIEAQWLVPSRVRLVHRGRECSFVMREGTATGGGEPRFDVGRFHEHLRQGATLVVNGVECAIPAVREISDALSGVYGACAVANAYGCFGRDEGFGIHYDDHDVFVVQVEGHKTWLLYGPTTPHPVDAVYRNTTPRPQNQPTSRLVLRPGDVLYLPRGHWHNALGAGVPSLHISFSVRTHTALALLTWHLERLKQSEFFRSDLPRFSDRPAQLRWAEELRDRLFSAWQDDRIVEEFSFAMEAGLPSRPRPDLEQLAGGSTDASAEASRE
jgi:ribosomal protein L16 Arg81 hydroxylase